MTVWLDVGLPGTPPWADVQWQGILQRDVVRLVAAASSPQDDGAIAALDAGCSGYCHAFADAATLKQVVQVVQAGQVWIGKSLMHRLLHGTRTLARPAMASSEWDQGLTQREKEVAILAANGASNLQIATDCSISERTVKAHLSAVFTKLNITDRLQLALRVHGIS
jgi:DNA-binding NarL/FixJ family response regulator